MIQTSPGSGVAAWPARCLFPLEYPVFIVCRAGLRATMYPGAQGLHSDPAVSVCAGLCFQQPSAGCALEKDARDLYKSTKLRRVLHAPLLALVWTYWFTLYFSPFWHVIWYWYFSFMSLKLGWRVQEKIVLLSGICEWRVNSKPVLAHTYRCNTTSVNGWCICFCRYCCRDHEQPMKDFRRKQGTWIVTKYGFAFWRGPHDQSS